MTKAIIPEMVEEVKYIWGSNATKEDFGRLIKSECPELEWLYNALLIDYPPKHAYILTAGVSQIDGIKAIEKEARKNDRTKHLCNRGIRTQRTGGAHLRTEADGSTPCAEDRYLYNPRHASVFLSSDEQETDESYAPLLFGKNHKGECHI